ncbi:unnamed protein product [Orchesella dallaii]|uniref:Uncharacterized protein n=1 Tax=Orchesella dallaii TaxID=48710 RepID=A0ABP1S101_9HEXA
MASPRPAFFLILAFMIDMANLKNQYAVLDFQDELRVFKTCMVQLVFNDIPDKLRKPCSESEKSIEGSCDERAITNLVQYNRSEITLTSLENLRHDCPNLQGYYIGRSEKQSETLKDLIRLNQSHHELLLMSRDIQKNVALPMRSEKAHLGEKIWVFQLIQIRELEKPCARDKILRSKLKTISRLDKKSEKVSKRVDVFTKRLDKLEKVWEETEANWRTELGLDKSQFMKMGRKERKSVVKLWTDRELIAAQEKSKFEDLKSEWDAVKGSLDESVMNCLRGVAEL